LQTISEANLVEFIRNFKLAGFGLYYSLCVTLFDPELIPGSTFIFPSDGNAPRSQPTAGSSVNLPDIVTSQFDKES